MSLSKRLLDEQHDESYREQEDVYSQPEYGSEEYFSYDRGAEDERDN